jgi:hypothetical protein
VLENNTKGYKKHPQLQRFKDSEAPLHCINQYLQEIFNEALRRNYSFDIEKINFEFEKSTLPVTTGQLNFEIEHLKKKLKTRDEKKLQEIKAINEIEPHPLFTVVEGVAEKWEKI